MAVTIKHAKTDTIADWTQADLDAQIALGNFPPGTVLADIVLPSDWNNDHTFTGVLPVANGGTGQTTFTDGQLLIGNSLTNGLDAATLTAGAGIGITNNHGSILISNTGGGGGGISGVTATAPIASSGGSTPNISITQAGTSSNGYLSSTDWNTFNGKGSGTVTSVALTAPSIFSVSGSPVTSSGTLALTYSGTALPVANGGTGVTSSSGANSVVLRDSNANITVNCLFEGYVNQAASGTLITLTASSAQNYQITGSGGQTIKLPDATTLPNGALFTFNNNQSSGTIVVQNNSGTTVDTLQSGAFSTVVLLTNSTSAGSWDRHNQSPANVSWSTNTFDYPGSITSATWNGTAIALNRGGTNANLTAVNGGAVYSTGSALAITAAGTSGQVLTSNGAGAPTWTTPTTGTVTSVTGTSPISSSGGNTPAISISQASTSTNGYLSSTDWNTFNNKQPAGSYLTTVTASSPLSGSGTAGSPLVISQATTSTDGYLSSTDWNTFNNKQPAGTYVTSVSATSPVTSTGGTTPTIAMPAATSSVNGYLTSTDWTTFNNKGSGTVTSVSVVSANGLAGTVATATTTPAITLSTTVTGLLKGNGTAISAATSGTDYAPATSGSSILYGNGSGGFSNVTIGSGLSFSTGTLSATGGSMVYPGAGIAVSTGSAWTTSLTAPSGAIVGTTDTQTLTNKRVTPRVSTTTSSATPTINTDNVDMYGLTAQAANITSFTTNLSGTPTDGQKLWIYIVGTAARTITWGASFESSTVTLPTTTVSTDRLDVGFVWNAATSKWRCVATA